MRSIVKRLTFLMVLMTLLGVPAWAGQYTVIVHVADGANIKAIADAYEGKVLDTLDTGTYLLQLKLTTPKYPVTGVEWIESDLSVGPSKIRGAVVSVTARTAPNWYAQQPAFQLIRENEALQLSRGSGIVVADINSVVDITSGFTRPFDVRLRLRPGEAVGRDSQSVHRVVPESIDSLVPRSIHGLVP